MILSKKWLNVLVALFLNFLIILVYVVMTPDITPKGDILMLIGFNNLFIFILYLLTFPLEPDKKR